MKSGIYLLGLLIVVTTFLFGQETKQDEKEIASQLNMAMPSITNPSLSSMSNLTVSVNESEYIVDAGDVFLIKIDVPGPAIRIFPVKVTADGYLILHDAPSIKVKRLYLNEAKKKVLDVLYKKNPDSEIEIFLHQVHPINVTVIGAVQNDKKQQLLSTSRLFDAVQNALLPVDFIQSNTQSKRDNLKEVSQIDPKAIPDEIFSLRRVEILRYNERYVYDLLRFRLLGELEHNPYLLDNDVVIVPYKGENNHSVLVEGAVGQNRQFGYSSSDKLGDAIEFAGGLLSTADSSKIELFRFAEDKKSLDKFILSFPEDKNFLLSADDRIYARYKAQYHNKFQIEVTGEVRYPGNYAIEEGKTKLSEIIKMAGGFTSKAALENATIIRQKILLEDKELGRLGRMTVDEMNDLEKSYFRLRNREDIRLVACNFEALFISKNSAEDVILRDEDLIVVPQKNKIVFLSGGVISPGNVVYDSSWTYQKYINTAGGFNKRAKRGNVKIIKSKTGVWLDANDTPKIEEGDIIFVPEKEPRDWWVVVKEGIALTSQIAAILFIIINVSK